MPHNKKLEVCMTEGLKPEFVKEKEETRNNCKFVKVTDFAKEFDIK
jgi:hypothetical protein